MKRDSIQYGSDKKFARKDKQGSRGAQEQGRKELTPIDSSSPQPPSPPAPLLPQRRDVLTERYCDSIYYQIFKRFPGLLFELVDYHPEQAQNYRFESVEVKETAFRIDGVFLPTEGATPRIIFFAEVQFQKDEALYHRFFTESMMYLNRNQSQYDDWRCVVIFPSRSLEPSDTTTRSNIS